MPSTKEVRCVSSSRAPEATIACHTRNSPVQRYESRRAHIVNRLSLPRLPSAVKFFLTSLGKPDVVVEKARRHGVVVYHDVHTPEVALKALASGVQGLNCLNHRMGGQTGNRPADEFASALLDMGVEVPLVCSGGISDDIALSQAMELGYAGALVGTRFLATDECRITDAYKNAVVSANEDDIVWTNKMAGTNSSVIRTPDVEDGGLRVGKTLAWLLRQPATKNLTRMGLLVRSMDRYKKSTFDDSFQFWQAGKGVGSITSIEPAGTIVERFGRVFDVPRRRS